MEISVIVCTYNRAKAITKCCEAIKAAIQASEKEAELIIVDNNSTDNTVEIIQNWIKTCNINAKLEIEIQKGTAAARNCGARKSRGELLIFTDDDCCLKKNYIEIACKHYEKDKDPILRGGYVALGNDEDLPLTIQTYPRIRRWSLSQPLTRPIGGGDILGCNMMVPRSIFNQVGDFDVLMGAGAPVPAGEDTDYVVRSFLAGYTIEYVPEAIVFHYHGRRSKHEGQKLMLNYAMGSGALIAKFLFKHPNIQSRLKLKKEIPQTSEKLTFKTDDPLDQLKPNKAKKIIYRVKGASLYYLAFLRLKLLKIN